MAAAKDMPSIKSGRIMHISELGSWAPDDVHGNSVRVLGRIKELNGVTNLIKVEYHSKELSVNTSLLGQVGQLRPGMLFQFLGELESENNELVLRARICRDMTGLDPDLFDRSLRVRRQLESRILPSQESNLRRLVAKPNFLRVIQSDNEAILTNLARLERSSEDIRL